MIGRVVVPLPVGYNMFVTENMLLINGDVPPVIGKDWLRTWNAIESHKAGILLVCQGENEYCIQRYLDDKSHSRALLTRAMV